MQFKNIVLTAALTLAAAPAVFAGTSYLTQTTPVNGQPGKDYLGTLDVASPVEVLEQKGDQVKVKVSGWSLKEYPSQIFTAPGIRIENASFDEESAVKLDPKAGEKTVQGNVWVVSSAEGWIPASHLTTDIEALWSKGKARQAEACSICHGAPAADHFTANQWASLLPVRGGRTGHTRKGNNELMFRWLQEHARQ